MPLDNYSSSPLSTLYPQTSTYRTPNYGMASLLYSLGRALSGSNNTMTNLYGQDLMNLAVLTPNFSELVLQSVEQTPLATLATLAGLTGENGEGLDLDTNNKKSSHLFNPYASIGINTMNAILPNKKEYNGTYGGITSSLDSVYDSTTSLVSSINPMVGGIMALGGMVSKGLNSVGMGTDGKTKTDAVLGSSFLSLTPVGLLNGMFGKRANKFDLDLETLSLTNGSYDSFSSLALSALDKSNAKYGLFSRGALKRANLIIAKALMQLTKVQDIISEGNTRKDLAQQMSAINGNQYAQLLQGGYDPNSVRIGKSGMLLNIQQDSNVQAKEDPKTYVYSRFPILNNISFELYNDDKFLPRLDLGKDFGDIEYMQLQYDTLPYYNNYQKPKEYKGKSVIVYNNNTINEDIALDALSHGLRELDSYWKNTIIPSLKREWDGLIFNEGIGGFSHKSPEEWNKLSRLDKDDIILKFYKSEDYENIVDGLVRQLLVRPELRKLLHYSDDLDYINKLSNTNAWKKALDYINTGKVPQHRNGGSIIELIKESMIELINPNDVPEFRNGGAVNVIPEGALHARKHNMDLEGITEKGIPVVSLGKDGKVELLAEIEREEIIFRLEVTLKLEELEKKYYSYETSKKEKDEDALEAGKLIIKELLYNTKDNAGLL